MIVVNMFYLQNNLILPPKFADTSVSVRIDT